MPYISGGGGGGAVSGVVISGAGASGKVPVASSASAGTWAFPPGFEIGYDQITATVNVVSTTEATGTTIITCAAHTFDGGPVLCTFFTPFLACPTAASSTVSVSLFEGATQLTELVTGRAGTLTADALLPATGMFRFTPTAASHTYTITAFASNTTGTPGVTAGAGGTGANPPCFVRFTKV